MADLVMQPLNEGLIASVYESARSWRPFQTEKKVLGYLEDRLTGIITCIHHDISGDRTSSRTLPELVALESFYTVALLRYLQQTVGIPTHIQHLPVYNTPEGNQVERYLEEFFKTTLRQKIVPS
ncbi:hypothetical protein HYW21_07285 [Candidatus Woesearchaeota archaeon]|nr:hypothetical protein [Candidatus Woesearchaeota archaeon]